MTNEEQHKALMDEWHEKYKDSYFDCTFTDDGSANWKLYDNSFPKILFLGKESPYHDYHPATPLLPLNNNFAKNIARWSLLIEKAFAQTELPEMPVDAKLRNNNDSVAIIEVKKICEEKVTSLDREINAFARSDREFLKRQIEILKPHVVLCCATIDSYDIINNWTYKSDEKIASIKDAGEAIWLTDDRLVIGFKHPSHRFGQEDVYHTLKSLLSQEPVKRAIQKMKDNSSGRIILIN